MVLLGGEEVFLEFLETVFMDFNKVFRKMVMTFEIIDI
jgi:hypothetical protein